MLKRVVVAGAAGRMGQTALRCLVEANGFKVVGQVLRGDNIEPILEQSNPDVFLELTTGKTAGRHANLALQKGIPTVIGATGIPESEITELEKLEVPCLLVPNFAIGAVLMMQFAAQAAKWLPDAEIIELHHEKKIDAPSGTAMRTAQIIDNSREALPLKLDEPLLKAEGARGATVSNVPIHSVRLRGLLAHQEVIFGGQGEVLTIRHDSLDRSSFEAGIVLSCREIGGLSGFHIGLETLLF